MSGYHKRLFPLEKMEGIQFLRRTEFSTLKVMQGRDYMCPKDISARSILVDNHKLYVSEANTATKALEKMGLLSRTYGALFKITDERKVDFVIRRLELINSYGLVPPQRNLVRFSCTIDRIGGGQWVTGKDLFRSMSASDYQQLNRFLRSGEISDSKEDAYGKKLYKAKEHLLSKAHVWKDVTAGIMLKIH